MSSEEPYLIPFLDHDSNEPNETTLLLSAHPTTRTPPRTPLPKVQIAILMVIQVGEPLMSQSIYPYINQLINDLGISGGDSRNVGLYAGLLESLFFATQALCVLQWSRASDHIGRKPVLLVGLLGAAISMFCFGLSRSFLGLVLSRCICGALNGNIGVMKSVIADLTDDTNRAEGFGLMPVVWASGLTGGSVLGGLLAFPSQRFPKTFSAPFWKHYPHFLPSLVVSGYAVACFFITLIGFRETVDDAKYFWRKLSPFHKSSEPHEARHSAPSSSSPVRLTELLTFPIVVSGGNYVSLALLDIFNAAILPLFCFSSIENGGLGLPPHAIGYIMGALGASIGIFQFFFFAKILKYFGERTVFIVGIAMFVLIFPLYPLISLVVDRWGFGPPVHLLLALLIVLLTMADLSFGAIFMFISTSTPSKRSLGATFGLSQTMASVVRAIGPAAATSVFSYSLTHHILGGYLVYLLGFLLSIIAVYFSSLLPPKVWDEPAE